jgi:WD40 repeat protein/3',5'-cyclic AMP phosphodiesterase CpdA
MSVGGDQRAAARPLDAFISHSPSDERWAGWLAWQLEMAGYRTLLQAWDLDRRTSLAEFTQRAVNLAAVTVVVLSDAYLRAPQLAEGRQVAMRADLARLFTVRVEECDPTGVPIGATHLDLTRVTDERTARERLFARLRPLLETSDAYQGHNGSSGALSPAAVGARRQPLRGPDPTRAPLYPPDLEAASRQRTEISILHVPGPRFGWGMLDPDEPADARALLERIQSDVSQLTEGNVPAPDLLVVSGDLTETAAPDQMEQAWNFLTGLRVGLGLDAQRMVIVPGSHDVSERACEAYFLQCEDEGVPPEPPYYPKIARYGALFADLYRGLDQPQFDQRQQWTLFEVPELRVVCAALNSTMAVTHRREDHYGQIGERQARWFAKQLHSYQQRGWFRIGVIRHDPLPSSTKVEDADTLHDAELLERWLGDRLNLLLHGPGSGGGAAELLGSMQVLPSERPGRYRLGRSEIVHVTADGLRRYPVGDAQHDHQHDVERSRDVVRTSWSSATATFTPSPARSGPDGAPLALEAADDKHGMLLERVAEVCASRWRDAWINRRLHTTPPQLVVTRQDGTSTRQERYGAYVGELTASLVEDFLRYEDFLRHDHLSGAELVYVGPRPGADLHRMARAKGARLLSYEDFLDQLGLSYYVSQQTGRLSAPDSRYPPRWYVPQRFRELGRHTTPQPDLVERLVDVLTADEGSFVLLLGDFGRGKSFALREVARHLGDPRHHRTPILIDLAAMDRSLSVESLVAAHLADYDEPLNLSAFRLLLGEGRIVLLFDGFDELVTRISYDRATEHLDKLVDAAQGRAKIVVASRTQHFRSHDQVFTALGNRVGSLANRRVFTVEEFTVEQISQYLANRHGDKQRAARRVELLRGAGDLLGLAQNPRMLNFIAELDEEHITSAARNRDTISPAGLYRRVLDSWLAHEDRRARTGRGDRPPLDRETMKRALTALAVRAWEAGETYLRDGELAEVTDALTGADAEALTSAEREHAVGSGSVLVRTDGGTLSFIHGSVMEWLVAGAIADELADASTTPTLLARQSLSQLTVDFLCDITDSRACLEWAEGVLSGGFADPVSRENADKISRRLASSANADLRGSNLRGHDLAYRDLAGADLTGADLTDAVLVGANLSQAILRDATLVGANLDAAVLVGADLSGADLRRARMGRADLTGATTSPHTRWARAALLGVTEAPRAAAAAGAAVNPGTPVEAELAPSSIGVRHSFDPEVDGLPQVVAYSPDGDTLAVGSEEGGVLICDAATGQPVRTLHGHRARVCTVAYAGSVLVAGANDGVVRVWDAASGRAGPELGGHSGRAWPLLVDAQGTLVAAGDQDGTLHLWDVTNGTPRAPIASAGGRIVSMAMHGSLLAVAYRDGEVHIHDTEGDMAAGTGLVVPAHDVRRMVFDSGGRLLVTGGDAGQLRAWDPSTGEQLRDMPGHAAAIHALAAHPSEPLLVTGDTAGAVRLWRLDDPAPPRVLSEAGAAIYGVAFSPTDALVAAGDRAGTVRLWHTGTGAPREPLTEHTGSIWPFVFRPDGRQLAISDDQRTTRLWDPTTGRCQHVLRGHGRRIFSVRFSADGALLATTGNDGRVCRWDTATGQQLRTQADSENSPIHLRGSTFSPVGPHLATVGSDGRIRILNTATGQDERHLHVPSAPIWAIAFSASGQELATANDDDTVSVWDWRTGRRMHTLKPHKGRVRSIAYSRDGARIATGCDDSAVRLWDAATGRLVTTLAGHSDRVYSVAFGRDHLVSASWDGTAIVWDLPSERPYPALARHTGRLWAAAFHPSGGLLATAGDDLDIQLWKVRQGGCEFRQSLAGHTRAVMSLAFNPAGDMLASGGDDGTARLWTVAGDRPATPHSTLLSLPHGWAALAPDHRYKTGGTVRGELWHVIGTCRFELGELDEMMTEIRHVPATSPL